MVVVMFSLSISNIAMSSNEFDESTPLGSDSVSDLDEIIQDEILEPIARVLRGYREGAICYPSSSTTIYVSAGQVLCSNTAGTVVKMRRNTTATAVTFANIDTGAEAASTSYYVYAVADADATTFTFVLSSSASAPTGVTYYQRIGYLYNDASSNIVNVGNMNTGNARNSITKTDSTDDTINDTTYGSDLTGLSAKFYSDGVRPTMIASGIVLSSGNNDIHIIVDVDGTDKASSERGLTGGTIDATGVQTVYSELLSEGIHTINVQAKVSSSTDVVIDKNMTIWQ